MRMLTLVLAVLALSAFIGCQSKPMVGSDVQSDREGITVHGNWTVEVRNPDGSLATSKQFTNNFYGKHIVAALLSLDLEVERRMMFFIIDQGSGAVSVDAQCKDYIGTGYGIVVPAKAIHAPNDDNEMFNSIWNASCTLEIAGNETQLLDSVATVMVTTPSVQKYDYSTGVVPAAPMGVSMHTLSNKEFDEPIMVWDGQVIAATVILSVD